MIAIRKEALRGLLFPFPTPGSSAGPHALLATALAVCLTCVGCNRGPDSRKASAADRGIETAFFTEAESLYVASLDACLAGLDSLRAAAETRARAPAGDALPTVAGTSATEALENAFRRARDQFKRAEPMLAWGEVENYKYLNGPNILRVEEEDLTNVKELEPSGFQAVEENLFADPADAVDWSEVAKHTRFTANRLRLIRHNADWRHGGESQFLLMTRDALLRLGMTGLSGFDSPVLERSLEESGLVLASLRDLWTAKSGRFRDPALAQAWQDSLRAAQAVLEAGSFASFDRFGFLQGPWHGLLRLWNRIALDWETEFPVMQAWADTFASPFSRAAFRMEFFSDPQQPPSTSGKASLGKRLFHDTRLSSTANPMSCATCHIETLGFAQKLKTPAGLTRNSLTVSYAALQKKFFWDGRAGGLEGQIVSVVESPDEFHSDLASLETALESDAEMVTRFAEIYPDTLTEGNVRNALADYVRSLIPFDSKFDRNMRGEESTLSDSERRGFNHFMGKAKCATCHFPPVFNGTIPPRMAETELEHLGTPETADTARPNISPDPGRFNFFGTESRRHFFKTPTLRNADRTAPYMHNGVFTDLEQVVDFYDRGGGAGLGIRGAATEFQTLPPDPLELSAEEKADLVAFMKTLTDAALENPPETAAE